MTPAAEPPPPPPAAPSTVDSLDAEEDQAGADAGDEAPDDDRVTSETLPATVEEAEATIAQQSVLFEQAMSATTTLSKGSPNCEKALRALQSMDRSAKRLCELAGTDDPRCTRALDKLSDATVRWANSDC